MNNLFFSFLCLVFFIIFFIFESISNNKCKGNISAFNNSPDSLKCKIYINQNWEYFESRYGRLTDEIIRKQLFPLIKQIKNELSSTECIYDVGGNIGEITQLFNEFYPATEIHTFEPLKSNFRVLNKKFSSIKNIKLNNIALGSFNGEKSTHTMGNGNVGDYLYPNRLLSEYEIKYMTVDSYYKDNCINLLYIYIAKDMDIFFFKLDTEGFEDEILYNSKYLLENEKIKIIYLEYHQGYCKEYESTLIHFLNNYGFTTYLVGKKNLYSTDNCPNHSLDRYSLGHILAFHTDKNFEKLFVDKYNKKYSQ